MQSIKEQSLIVSAIRVLEEKKEPMEFYTLFTLLCDEKDYNKKERAEYITRFYSDITTSAKFVYTGDNHWDLKERQKIELWEKDGSYFKEYTEIKASDYTDVNLEEPAPKPKKVRVKKAAKKVKKAVDEPEVLEVIEEVAEIVETPIEVAKEEVKEEVAKVSAEAVQVVKEKIAGEDGFVEYEEDVQEEYEDDFDEDKYNEYMDTYEDKYDNKK